jgi:hypothetical protein
MDILFFPNGNTAVFEQNIQISVLQKGWLELFAEFLESKDIDPTLVNITARWKKSKVLQN